MFIGSPTLIGWPATMPPTTTVPVLTPIRIRRRSPTLVSSSSLSASSSSNIAMAELTARVASSSCARWAPKTPITPSPARCSISPPCATTTPAIRSRKVTTSSRKTSGSSRSAIVVEPTRSAKTAVIFLRYSPERNAIDPPGRLTVDSMLASRVI